MDTPPTNTWAWIGAGIAGLISGAMWFRTKMSRDAAEMANHRAEIGMLDRLQQENRDLSERLETVMAERNRLYRDMAEMAGQLKALEIRQKEMEGTIQSLTAEVDQLRSELHAREASQ